MPITGIRWDPDTTANRDIHVLRGQSSADLTIDRLQFVVDEITHPFAHDYLTGNTDVALAFAVVPDPADDVFANQGIDIDADTGAGERRSRPAAGSSRSTDQQSHPRGDGERPGRQLGDRQQPQFGCTSTPRSPISH